ncbi:MAG: hypothetical protein LC808_00105 [Actinobacteria bacterium]|nr:hypothetical protein [Actinomycetota bacterium]
MDRQSEYGKAPQARLRLIRDDGSAAGPHNPDATSYWDALPRDGPAVFVADTALLDAGLVKGCWLDLEQS